MFRSLLLSLAAALLAAPSLVAAQTVTVTTPNTVNPSGQPLAIGKTFIVNADGTIASPIVAQGSTTAGQSGQLDQCAVVSGDQVYTAGTTQPLNCTASGRLKVGLSSATNVTPAALPTTTTQASLLACRYLASPPTWSDGWTGAIGCDTTGGLRAVLTPTASAINAITPVVNSAVGSALVVKASAGNLYSVNIVTGATAGYLLIFNATTAPADGAVAPIKCLPVAANVGIETNMRSMPEYFSTGIVAVFSSTGCFTKTASATAFMSADAK